MVWVIAFFTLVGFNLFFWILVGLVRFIFEKIPQRKKRKRGRPVKSITPLQVAAVIPAHNEEETIGRTIQALLKVLPKKNIYVASDFSTDKTVKIARKMSVNVLDIKPNMGKAKALVHIMKYFKLLRCYKALLINDADVEIDRDYLNKALPLFLDKKITAVAPHGTNRWRNYSVDELFFITYRIRLWRVIQLAMRFGQTWKFTNTTFIVPGSLSLYRTKVLKKIEIDAPGLVIEDFNMTFELHKKRLGKIAYHPSIYGIHQDPYNLRDYINQVKRWNLGFWQTVKRNGIWPSFFWLSTGAFIAELLLYSLFLLTIPLQLGIIIINSTYGNIIPIYLSPIDLFIGVFLMDYLITIIAAIWEKKPILLVYGLFFFSLRYIDAFLYLYTLPLAFFTNSSGIWKSPGRK